MTFSTLAKYFEKLDATPKRLEITAILCDLIKAASVDEIDKILYLTAGRLGPLFDNVDFNLADKMMFRVLAVAYGKEPQEIAKQFGKQGDLGDLVKNLCPLSPLQLSSRELVASSRASYHLSPLSVIETYTALHTLAADSGSGSQDRKVQAFASLLKKMDPLSAKYLVRIPLGKLRLGFSDLTVLDALSYVEAGDKSARVAIERAYNVYPDIGQIAKTLRSDGLVGLKKIKLTAGVPVLPQRCSLVTSAEEMLTKSDSWMVQPKYDGLRVQIHFGVKEKKPTTDQISLDDELPNYPTTQLPNSVRIFSRGLEDITNSMPEISTAIISLISPSTPITPKNFILDGEAISVDPKTGQLLPFDETITRKRKHDIAASSESTPLKVFVFDLLLLNNENLTDQPYEKRYQLLSNLIGNYPITQLPNYTILLTPAKTLSDPQAISKLFKQETSAGLEGIVAKKPNDPYAAGARNFSWVKMKREETGSELTDTIDCVVLGYYFGEGKRNDFGIGAFLVGLYDPSDDTFKTVAKIGTGVTDEEWRELKKKCDEIKLPKISPRVIAPISLIPHINVDPQIVVAIRADQVTKSPLHSSGYSLRFPRLIAYREKLPEDGNTVRDVEKMLRSS